MKVLNDRLRRGAAFLRWVGAWAAVLLVASCGGGGGGGETEETLRITVDRNAVAFDYLEGATTPAAAQVVATAAGPLPATIYLLATTEGDDAIALPIPLNLRSDGADAQIQPKADLPAGHYSGRVIVSVCSDSACQQRIGGTPLTVTYDVTVQPRLKTTPTTLELAAVSGNPAAGSLQVQLPQGASSFTARVTAGEEWLQLGTPAAGALPVTAASWRSGVLSGQVEITTDNGQKLAVPVRYSVGAPVDGDHDLAVAPGGLTFGLPENGSAAQTLVLTLPSWDAAPVAVQAGYAAGETAGWLAPDNRGASVVVAASSVGLAPGTYHATLRLDAGAPSVPVTVPVTLTVGPGLVAPADRTVVVDADTTSLTGYQIVETGSGTLLAWQATSSAAWLQLTSASGNSGQPLVWAFDAAAFAAMPNFSERSADVTISAANVSPVSFRVTLRKQLPEVHAVGPRDVLAGGLQHVIVRGRGFDHARDPGSWLQTPGFTRSAVKRVNDTELTVDGAILDVGAVPISIGNALQLDTGATTLQALAPQTYPYAGLPSSGVKRALVFDWRRRALYAANSGQGLLQRWRFNGLGWVSDQVAVPGIIDAGLAPDGELLLVISEPGKLQLFDPATLESRFVLDHAPGFLRWKNRAGGTQGIANTNDGRSWLVGGHGDDFGTLLTFDHRTRTLQPWDVPAALQTHFFDGPWLSATRDGDRLLLVQTLDQPETPDKPVLYAEAADLLLQANPMGLMTPLELRPSDDGSRLMVDQLEVRDRNFELVGSLPQPVARRFTSVGGAISPDGRRTYVIAYPDNSLDGGSTRNLAQVYVFDSNAPARREEVLTLLGQIDMPHYPGCRSTDTKTCDLSVRATVSPDGRTLFVAGDLNVVVLPIPDALKSP